MVEPVETTRHPLALIPLVERIPLDVPNPLVDPVETTRHPLTRP